MIGFLKELHNHILFESQLSNNLIRLISSLPAFLKNNVFEREKEWQKEKEGQGSKKREREGGKERKIKRKKDGERE